MAKKYLLLLNILLFPVLASAHPTYPASTYPIHPASAHPSHPSGVEYLKNLGQWDGNFLYRCNTSTGDIFLEPNGITYVVGAPDNKKKIEDIAHGRLEGVATLFFHAYKVKFENAQVPVVTSVKELETYNNYYLGNDPGRWKTGIHPALEVHYDELYEGIDLHVGSAGNNMKYEFVVAAGANPYIIKLNFDGADKLSVKNGDLVIGTSLGDAIEQKPFVYQMVNGQRQQVACNYRVKGRSVSYEFPDGYNSALPLIIDPMVVFATFTGSTADNFGFTATYDNDGNFYGGGLVAGLGFPVLAGAFQTTFGGGGAGGTGYGCDMGIIKFSPDGINRIYGTYIGGFDNETPHSMIVDANNNLVIAGRTYSNNFPVTGSTYDNTFNGGGDITVTKLNADATALLGSTYIGGPGDDGVNGSAIPTVLTGLKYNFGDDARSEVIIDNAGNIYVAASTQTNGFPTTVGAPQTSLSGFQDAVIFKFNPTITNLIFSTYFGGPSDDNAYVLALDPTQTNLYVAGGTQGGMPFTGGTWQTGYQGGSSDGYIAKFQNSGSYTLQNFTYIGTGNMDQCYGIQTDDAGAVYAMGLSVGGQFPVNNVTYFIPNTCQFVIKLDANLAGNIYSTTFGPTTGLGSNATNISPTAFLVDTCENVYVSGWGGQVVASPPSIGFTLNMPITTDAAQSTTDGSDFYFIVLQKNITGLLYGSYMGQNNPNGEHVDGGTSRFDKNGVIYQAICGGCGGTTFPTTPGVWSPNNASTNCNLAALKIHFDFLPVVADAEILGDTFGCAPYTVQFQNNSTTGGTIVWIFDDGTPNSTDPNPTHTFVNPGVYDVMLIVENAQACNQTIDTDIITITVDSGGITAAFTMAKVDTCGPFTATFVNTSTYSGNPGAEQWTIFNWDFGDGTGYTGVTPPMHTFPDTGTYTITLTMLDTSACNPLDSVTQTIQFRISRVEAATLGDTLCLNESPVTMQNLSVNGTTYNWTFSNGFNSSAASPTFQIDSPGTYTAYVIAGNPATCNKFDTSDIVTIQVYPVPTADFAMTPNPHIRNKPLEFINNSTGTIPETTYAWDFGDNTKSDLKDPPPHMYLRKGTYNICLTVTNPISGTTIGCPSVVCKSIAVDIKPIIDIPTAFSPNGDGVNEMLYVRGAAITEIDLKIFNRWGELVFETTTLENDNDGNLRSKGWDGKLRGKEQEMDSYAFVLRATFIDGTTHEEQGNITLIR